MALFDQKAPSIMSALIRDTGMKDFQAGGVLGNIGWECGGFASLHQIGGNAVGWAQWDGNRKIAFLQWCVQNKLAWQSDEANYRYLVLELKGSERAALNALLGTTSLEGATITFEAKFERAGVPAIAGRQGYAARAMAAYVASTKQPATYDQPVIVPAEPRPKLTPKQPDDPGPIQPAPSGLFAAVAALIKAILAAIFPGK